MNYSYYIKTNAVFLNLRDSMWALNKVVINVFPSVWELVCKLQNSCVYLLRRQPVPKSSASCSYFKWAVLSTFKWNLQHPTSLPLKFFLLSAFLSSFSSSCIQKGNLFVIDYTFACLLFCFCVLLCFKLAILYTLVVLFLSPTHIQRSKKKRKAHIVSLFFSNLTVNTWCKRFYCILEDAKRFKPIKNILILMF